MKLAIIHSHNIDIHGEPNAEYKGRLSEGALMLYEGKIDRILLTGGFASSGIDIRHCDAGKRWLLSQGVADNDLSVENDPHGSLESVGEMVFARKDHEKIIHQADQINVITSNYHIGRLWEIGSFVMGDNLRQKLCMIGIPVENPRSLEQERSSLQAFHTTFAGVPLGDLQKIEERLWTDHKLYKNHPSNNYIKPHR